MEKQKETTKLCTGPVILCDIRDCMTRASLLIVNLIYSHEAKMKTKNGKHKTPSIRDSMKNFFFNTNTS